MQNSKLLMALLSALALLALGACETNCHGRQQSPEQMRIISHLPSFTEIALALGLEDRLVGATDYCQLPPGSHIARVGGQINPDLERSIALRPTLALLPDSQIELKAKYQQLGIDTVVGSKDTLADLFASITNIGRATGRQSEAAQLTSSIESRLETIRLSVAERKPVDTLLVIGHEPGSLREIYIAGGGSWHGELLTLAGGHNIFGEIEFPYPKVSKEEILKRDPQAIILISDHSGFTLDSLEAEKKLWSEFSYLDAVKKDRIYLIEGDFAFVPGPQVDQLADRIARLLFGDNS